MPTKWRLYQHETVAGKLEPSELPGFFRKQVVVGPNEAAMVLRDGQPVEVLTEARVKVADIFDRIKSLFGLGPDLQVFFLDLSPFDVVLFLGQSLTGASSGGSTVATSKSQAAPAFQIDLLPAAQHAGWTASADAWSQASGTTAVRLDVSQVALVALSADREIVQAVCNIRLRIDINPDDPVTGAAKVAALLKGKRALATWDIAALLRDEDYIGSLVTITRCMWTEFTVPDMRPFVFFGSASGGETWGIDLQRPSKIIAFHHHMEDEYEIVGTDIVEVYRADYARYKMLG